MRKTLNYYFLFDDTLFFHHNASDMLLLTDQLNLKCYLLYETKESLTITKMYFFIINILMLFTSIVIVIIIIIIIIITSTVITMNIIAIFVKSVWRIFWIFCNSCVTWLLTSNFLTYFFIYLFFVQMLQWINITWGI